MEGNSDNFLSNAIGAIVGIFGNLGKDRGRDSQHIYYEGIVIRESELDKTPYVFAGVAVVLIALSIVFLIQPK